MTEKPTMSLERATQLRDECRRMYEDAKRRPFYAAWVWSLSMRLIRLNELVRQKEKQARPQRSEVACPLIRRNEEHLEYEP